MPFSVFVASQARYKLLHDATVRNIQTIRARGRSFLTCATLLELPSGGRCHGSGRASHAEGWMITTELQKEEREGEWEALSVNKYACATLKVEKGISVLSSSKSRVNELSHGISVTAVQTLTFISTCLLGQSHFYSYKMVLAGDIVSLPTRLPLLLPTRLPTLLPTRRPTRTSYLGILLVDPTRSSWYCSLPTRWWGFTDIYRGLMPVLIH
jgi:hypothetical protein